MFSTKMHEQDSNKLRGRSAIEAAHAGVTVEDESRLDAAISDLYGVDNEEAIEIHANYHVDKILASLARRARENGMKRQAIADRLKHLDVAGVAFQVAKGKLTEAAAVDALFRGLSTIESSGKADDRFSIYG
jgi:ribosomal protein L12E/L44/L45/RPP1/RPP2